MAGNNIVVNILGNNRGLTRALAAANREIQVFARGVNNLAGVGLGPMAAVAGGAIAAKVALGAAGIAAGALAAGLTTISTVAIGGGLIAVAAQAEQVKSAFRDLGSYIGDTMKDLTKPLQEPLVRFAASARGAFDNLKPSISAITASLAPLIDQIGGKLAPLAERVGPLLVSMFESGKAPLLAFIDGLTPLTDGLKKMFDTLNNPEVSRFVTVLMESLGRLMPMLGQLLVALTPLGTEALPVLVDGFGKLVNVLVNDIIPAVSEIAGNVWPVFVGVMEQIGSIIKDVVLPAAIGLSEWMRDHQGLVETLVLAFIAFKVAMVAIGVVMAVVNGVMAAYRLITLAVTAAQWLWNAAMLANPIGLIIVAIVAVIAVIALLIYHWDTVKAFLIDCWNAIVAAAQTAWNFLRDFFVGLWQSISDGVTTAWSTIRIFISTVADAIWQYVVERFNALKDGVANAITTAQNVLSTVWNTIVSLVKTAAQNVWQAVVERFNAVRSSVTDIMNSIIGFISGLPGRFVSMGRDLIQGLINGIRAMASAVASAARSVVEGAINAAKSALRIGSPSKLFIQFGKWTGQGFVIGINRESDNVYRAGASIGAAAADGIKSKPFFIAGLTIGEQMAAGLNAAGGTVANASSALAGIMSGKFKGVDARIALDSAAGAFAPGNRDVTIVVNAGVGDPTEIGRSVVGVLKEYEAVNGTRWRE